METAIHELSEVISAFHAAPNNEIKSQLESRLVAWRQNPESLAVCVAVIASPAAAISTQLFCLVTLIDQLRDRGLRGLVQEMPTEEIMQVCIARLKAGVESEPIAANLLMCLAVCAFYDRRLVDKGLELDLEMQLAYLDYFLREPVIPNTNERIERIKKENPGAEIVTNQMLDMQRSIAFDEIMNVLNAATHVSRNWLALHKSALAYGDISAFACLLPKLQTVTEVFSFEFGGELMTLYESILTTAPLSLSKDDLVYIKNVIGIMMTLEAKIMKECDKVDQAIPYAFVILKETLDYGMDFFGMPEIVEFSEGVFKEAEIELQVFLRHDLDEFYDLFGQIAETLAYKPPESGFDQSKWIIAFVHFVNELVSANHFELCDSRMRQIVSTFTSTHDEKLMQYLASCIGQLGAGILYIIACNEDIDEDDDESGNVIQKCLVRMVVEKMMTMQPQQIPVTVLYFIKKCAKYALEHSEMFLNIVFYWMAQGDPLSMVPKVLLKLSMLNPRVFITEDNKYIEALIQLLGKSDAKTASSLFAVLFSVIPHLTLRPDVLIGKLDQIGKLFIGFLPTRITNIEEFNGFCRIVAPIFARGPQTEEMSPVISSFYNQIFERVQAVIGPLWDVNNDHVQMSLSELSVYAVNNRWISSHAPVIEWVSKRLQTHPMIYHCQVIEYLVDDLPIPLITEFLRSMPRLDSDLVCAQLSLLEHLCVKRPELLKTMMPLEVLLYPISSRETDVFKAGVSMVTQAFESGVPFAHEEVVAIVKAVTEGLFLTEKDFYPQTAFSLLHQIGTTIPEIGIANIRAYMLTALQSLIGPNVEQPPVKKLLEMFEVESPNQFIVGACLREIDALIPK